MALLSLYMADFSRAIDQLKRTFSEAESEISQELAEHFALVGANKDVQKRSIEHFRHCVSYTVSDGKMTRGATVVLTLLAVRPEATSEEQRVAGIMGCGLEILQSAFLVLDDIMDKSTMRRGKPCWHLVPSVGMANAVNDGLFLENAVFALVRRCVPADRRLAVYELINQTVLRTVVGQNLDVSSVAVSDFTDDRYNAIIKSKTAFYSFCLPVALGCVLADVNLAECADFLKARDVCISLGEYFQIQDDVLDCYADAAVLGKKGTDIEEGKCTWLAVEAMKRGSETDRAEITRVFSQDERSEEDVAVIKRLYTALNLLAVFESFELEKCADINRQLELISNNGLKQVLALLLARIHKRHK